MRIIQISGLRGIMLIVVCISCLVAGFAIFPSFVLMCAWNFIAEKFGFLPQINVFQGFLLWIGLAISLYLSNERQKYLVSFSPKRKLSEEEVRKLVNRVRLQRMHMLDNQMVLKSDNIKAIEKESNHDKSEEKENI